MLLFKNTIFFAVALIFHNILLYFFFVDFYALYFISLVVFGYFLYKYYAHFSLLVFSFISIFCIVIINLNIYKEFIFEVTLYFDLIKESIYVNSEVMYILLLLHYFLLLNLKKFDNF